MALPPRVLFTLLEVAARWGCTTTDIAEWAALERLELLTSVPLVQAGDAPIVGLVALHAADLMPMFRRDGSGPPEVRVHRLRPQNQDQWVFITTPAKGVRVAKADLLISATEMTRFEEENELVRRPSSQPAAYKYDWDAMYVAVIKRNRRSRFHPVPVPSGAAGCGSMRTGICVNLSGLGHKAPKTRGFQGWQDSGS